MKKLHHHLFAFTCHFSVQNQKRLHPVKKLLFLIVMAAAGFPSLVRASIINFEDVPPSCRGQMSTCNHYGSTPEVTVSYGSYYSDGSLQCDCLWWWGPGYGDLPAAAWHNAIPGHGEIILTPIAGYSITLNSFDMASYGGGSYFESMI